MTRGGRTGRRLALAATLLAGASVTGDTTSPAAWFKRLKAA
ncbi:hypothetical protein [Streptomyces sp. NPDC048637]